MCGEIATDLGDSSIFTRAQSAAVPGLYSSPASCIGSVDPLRPRFWAPAFTALVAEGRGSSWGSAATLHTCVNTILPPNREVCFVTGAEAPGATAGGPFLSGVATVSSRHQGGGHVLMGDGAVKFITDSISTGIAPNAAMVLFGATGASAPGSQSPYGLWGSLGTRASKETISSDF